MARDFKDMYEHKPCIMAMKELDNKLLLNLVSLIVFLFSIEYLNHLLTTILPKSCPSQHFLDFIFIECLRVTVSVL